MKYLIILVLALSANTFAQQQKTDVDTAIQKYTNIAVCSGYLYQLSKITNDTISSMTSIKMLELSKEYYNIAITDNIIPDNSPKPKNIFMVAKRQANKISTKDVVTVISACMLTGTYIKNRQSN